MRRIVLLACLALLAMAPASFAQQARGGDVLTTRENNCGFLGVYPADVTSRSPWQGAEPALSTVINGIISNTGAQRAGIQQGDIVVAFNGAKIQNAHQFRELVLATKPGTRANIEIVRAGQPMTIDAEITRRFDMSCPCPCDKPSDPSLNRNEMHDLQDQMRLAEEQLRDADRQLRETLRGANGFITVNGNGRLGLSMQNLTPQLAKYFGLGERPGSLISDVRESSPAQGAGLQAGDVIVAVDGQAVTGPADVVRLIGGRTEGSVDITVIRDRQERTVTIQLENGMQPPAPAPQDAKPQIQENPDLGTAQPRIRENNLMHEISQPRPLGLAK